MRGAAYLSTFGLVAAFSSGALAADLPARPIYKSPAAVVSAAYNWTGVYIGGHAGYGRSKLRGSDLTFGGDDSFTASGFVGGGQIGANYQIGSVVLGIEGEYSYSDVKKDAGDFIGNGASFARLRNDYFATVAGRLGYAFDRLMIYAKGGAAWTRDKLDVADGTGGTLTGRFNRTGWVVGGGVEWAVFGNWSAKVEYDYMRFGSINEQPVPGGNGLLTSTAASVSARTQIVKAGVNYRF